MNRSAPGRAGLTDMRSKMIGVILAAGRSRRFGPRDKLLARRPGSGALVQKPACALKGLGLMGRIAIARTPSVARTLHGTRTRALPISSGRTQSASLHRALRVAHESGASHLLIVLGDMPGVTRKDLRDLMRRAGPHPVMASCAGRVSPPALIPRRLFGRVLRLSGDRGAGPLLSTCPDLRRVALALEAVQDVDRPDELDADASKPSRA